MRQNADQNNSEYGYFLRSVGPVTKLDKRNTETSKKKKNSKQNKTKQNDDVMSANSDSSVFFLIYD